MNYNNCSFINLNCFKTKPRQIGKPTKSGAKTSLNALEIAIDLFKKNEITSLVTAPVCKETISKIKPTFTGHTEFLAKAFNKKFVGMMFVADKLRTIVVTRHIPLNKVSAHVNPSNVYNTIRLTHQTLKHTFNIKNPSIAVCGMNPHAGEGGTIGKGEITKIIPAIKKGRHNKMRIEGPFAADTLFSPDVTQQYDAIVAIYHDQGLIPMKTLCFTRLVNLTIGLPLIRTSPAHGTAFNIAGKNKADPSSMCEAIKLAAVLTP